jgi:diacylglycerol O-acyltransferase / wax synthase
MRQLTSLDAQFLAMESARTYGHVSGLAVYDPSTAPGGRVRRDDICRLISERLHMLPPFRWRLAEVPFGIDHPYWVDDPDFDLDFHIRETAAPPPGDDHALAEQVARIVARPLDRRRPLWELYLIHGLPEGRVAVLTKIHHAAVDGVSGAEILGVMVDLAPEGREIPPRPDDCCGERMPGQLEMLGRGVLGTPRQPLRALGALPSAVPNLADLPGVQQVPGVGTLGRMSARAKRLVGGEEASGLLEPAPVSVPRTRFNQAITPHRRFSFGSLPLDRVKAIKNELGISVNDVVVSICATAMRDWLLERDELPEEPLVAMVPVSVRTEEEIGTFGNRVGVMVVPIPTDVADPRKRLMRAHEILGSAKTRHRAVPASLLQDVTQFIPPAVYARAARATMQLTAGVGRPALNLVISNVPGPPMPLYCAGARLEANYPVSVVTDGVGLNITCMSYRDHLDFGIVVDRDMVDDAWELMEAHRHALEEIDAVICGRRVVPSRHVAGPYARKQASPSHA